MGEAGGRTKPNNVTTKDMDSTMGGNVDRPVLGYLPDIWPGLDNVWVRVTVPAGTQQDV